jgi:hypothetical protein
MRLPEMLVAVVFAMLVMEFPATEVFTTESAGSV